jgi:hypothetical protein
VVGQPEKMDNYISSPRAKDFNLRCLKFTWSSEEIMRTLTEFFMLHVRFCTSLSINDWHSLHVAFQLLQTHDSLYWSEVFLIQDLNKRTVREY